jgi:galactokinase
MKKEWNLHFRQSFGTDAEVFVKAPGRINVIGEHTDYNYGFVLPAAIDRYMVFALSENKDSNHTIVAYDVAESLSFNPDIATVSASKTWMRYVQSVFVQLNLRGHQSKPVNCIFGGTIPQGGGMSSSAAMCGGLIFSLSELNDWHLTRKQIALIAQAAEHGIGIKCGIMDQYATLFGKKDQVMLLDCRNLETSHFPMNLGPYAMFLINSMQTHEFATESEYNNRRASCESVVAIIQNKYPEIKSLRDVTKQMLTEHQAQIDEISYQRAFYIIEENERVFRLVAALKENRLEELGVVLREAHDGMKNLYEITTPEIDFLVDYINNYPGNLGARMMGGGFGGCTINFVNQEIIDQCCSDVLEAYESKFGRTGEIYRLTFQDGVNVF